MPRKALPLAVAFAFTLLSPRLAMANDAVAGLSGGGIVLGKTDAIAMKKEVLNVSHALISVDYEFVNESSSSVDETIVFPLPVYPAAYPGYDTYYGQPNGFSIRVNGKPVAFTSRVLAWLEGRDVTAELKKLGLSDAQIALSGHFEDQMKVKPLSAAQRQRLTELNLIGDVAGDGVGPLWGVQINYVWKQTFPAGQVVRVHHEYRPFVSWGAGEVGGEGDFAKTYCADREFFKAHRQIKARSGSDVSAAKVSYILKSANTWKNGIEDFTLNLVKQQPDELVSLCFPGKFNKLDAHTYQVHLKNFHPTSDLEVYFGNLGTMADNQGVLPVLPR